MLSKFLGKHHLLISIVLFVACLPLPGFYTGNIREPHLSIELLATGWLGWLGMHFSWFANPSYFLALLLNKSKPKASLLLAIIALLLALSFLLHSKILVNEGGGTRTITGYGWGYFLWVMAIAIFASEQAKKCLLNANEGVLVVTQYVVLGIGIAAFAINYYLGENSQFLIDRDRSNYFADHCDEAMEAIYEPAQNVQGIYFSPDWGASYGRSKFGKYSGSQVGALGLGFINSGVLPFYEVDNNKKGEKPYKRYYRGDFRGEEVSTIASNYSVLTENLSKGLRPELGIYFAHITIISSDKNKTIAEAKYLVSFADHKICLPNPEKGFSTLQFAYQTFKSVMKPSFDNGKH